MPPGNFGTPTPNGSGSITIDQIARLQEPIRGKAKQLNELINSWFNWSDGPVLVTAIIVLFACIGIGLKATSLYDPSIVVIPRPDPSFTEIVFGVLIAVGLTCFSMACGLVVGRMGFFRRRREAYETQIKQLLASDPIWLEALEVLAGMSWRVLDYAKKRGYITKNPLKITEAKT